MLSDDQKKPGFGKPLGGAGLPGALPGMKPGGGLPGLGMRPGGGGGLPGMRPGGGGGGLPGMKPGGSGGLPGMKPGGGGLPGMKPSSGAAMPPFMQPQQPTPAPQTQQQQPATRQDSRDPFGQASAPTPSQAPQAAQAASNAMMMAAMNETSIEDAPLMTAKSRKTLLIAVMMVGVITMAVGFLFGQGISGRRELNIAIRDALIIEYELKEAGKLFNEVQTMISAALNLAGKREFDKKHLDYLKNNVPGNPLKATILTERNYKKFDPSAVQWLIDYYKKWNNLYGLIQEHRRSTDYDIKPLTASKAEFTKLLQTNYGVVFAREKQSKKFIGNIVLLGAEADGKIQVQVDASTYASERELYNPEGEDSSLTKEPDKYVVPLGPQSKAGLLSNATQSHFKKYAKRLKEISDLMKGMSEIQQNLLNKISEICSQEPAALVDPDPEEALEEYISHSKSVAPAE
jgi:hypothetical protein